MSARDSDCQNELFVKRFLYVDHVDDNIKYETYLIRAIEKWQHPNNSQVTV